MPPVRTNPVEEDLAASITNQLTPERRAQAQADAATARGGGASNPNSIKVPWLSTAYRRAKQIKDRQAQIDKWQSQWAQGVPDAKAVPGQDVGANYMNPEATQPAAPEEGMQDPTSPFYMNPEAAEPKDEVVVQDIEDVLLEPHRWTTEEYADITQQMLNVGLLDEGFSMRDVEGAWKEMVEMAARRYAARPEDLLTPLDMLDIGWGNGEGSEGSAVKRDPVKVVTEGMRITTNEQARGLLRGMLANKLGRKPTAVEVDDLQAALNEAQRANPTRTTTTNYLNAAGRETGQSVVEEGGIDPNDFAEDWTDWRDPESEYGKYQAASTYYNALRQAIVGPGGA